jgi:glycosyltransferase involved in cell wall biosynthesis
MAAGLLGISPRDMTVSGRHVVLPRGIDEAPNLPRLQIRKRLRAEFGIPDHQILVLSIGRIFREKGIFELLEAFSLLPEAANVTCLVVGSVPAFDETIAVQKVISASPALRKRVTLVPACKHEDVWEYLCAADIFTFSSHHEGMPNSLLEAMVMGLPAIAYGIPPILELEAGEGALMTVKPFDAAAFAQAIIDLAASSDARVDLGKRGRAKVLDRFMVRKNMAEALELIAGLVKNNHSN